MSEGAIQEIPTIKDSIKLLLTLKAATEQNLSVNEELFPSYIYLLNAGNYLTFNYVFTFEPLPYSKDISEDTDTFSKIGFVTHSSPIRITKSGEDWLTSRMETFKPFFTKIQRAPLSDWVRMDSKDLFNHVYKLMSTV